MVQEQKSNSLSVVASSPSLQAVQILDLVIESWVSAPACFKVEISERRGNVAVGKGFGSALWKS